MPLGNWKIWFFLAGRGFGQTYAAAYAISQLIKKQKVFISQKTVCHAFYNLTREMEESVYI